MKKMKMQTNNIANKNCETLINLFPNAITEITDDNGETIHAIDADILEQEINIRIVKGREERYQFTWPGKRRAILAGNMPTDNTLRPHVAESMGRNGAPAKFDSENLYIEGDNLEVIKLLQETYLSKIKMIYIDPPYNTGNDFVYKDNFSKRSKEYLSHSGQYDENGGQLAVNLESNGRFHTDWLNMIYPRIKLSKNLLSDDGFIAISIGEEELHNLKKICDEIFGELNFRNMIAVRRYDKNLNLQFAANGLSTMNVGLEYILIYSKFQSTKMKAVYKESSEDRSNVGYWKGFWNNADRPTMRYEVLGVTPPDGQWKWKKDIADEAIANYITYQNEYASKMTIEDYWALTGKTKRFIRRNQTGVGKNQGVEHWVAPADGILRNSNWSDMLISKPAGMDIIFDSPKNPDVLLEIMRLFNVSSNDIVLDFFSGSATTAHAVMQLNAEDGGNRKFIMVQLPEETPEKSEARKAGYSNICEIGKERIRRAGAKIKEETGADIDYGFRVLKCADSNMKPVYYAPSNTKQEQLDILADNIKEDRTGEDLLFQVMLELGVPLSSTIEYAEIAGQKVFDVGQNYLLACFDLNVTVASIIEIAKREPTYFVMRDRSMANDTVAANFEQIFRTYSPDTVRRVL